jgi:lipoate-protein ligase A
LHLDPVAPWRLLIHGADDAAQNMAVDEAILESYAGEARPPAPTLRLYSWSPAAVSLGRSQPAQRIDAARLRREAIDLVRRPTGGGAVLHDHERTYAVIASLTQAPFDAGVVATYRAIAAALVRGLRSLGLAAVEEPAAPRRGTGDRDVVSCFDVLSAHEIRVGAAKLVGSAQARRRRAVLQQGSIPLRSDPARVATLLGAVEAPDRHGDLLRAGGGAVDPARLDEALVEGFRAELGAGLVRSELSEREALRAAQLRCWKYDSASWTFDGRPGARERRWGPPIGA